MKPRARRTPPPAKAASGLAGRLQSVARRLRVEGVRLPARRAAAPPPPSPPHVVRAAGVAARLPVPEIPLPPRAEHELPPPPRFARPNGLASRIPPLSARLRFQGRARG